MVHEVSFRDDIAIVEVEGSLTIDALVAMIDALNSHPRHRDGMNALFDLRRADLFSIHPKDFAQAFDVHIKHRERLARKAAIVVSSDLDFGMVRVWDAKVSMMSGQRREVFRDMNAALAWLRDESPDADT